MDAGANLSALVQQSSKMDESIGQFSMELPEIPQPFSVIHPFVLHTQPVKLIATAHFHE
jgi:hypothetical protein